MEEVIGVILTIVLLIATYLLSSKLYYPVWGSVIPVVIFIVSIYIFASGKLHLEWNQLFPFLLLNVAFLSIWESGRATYKKKIRQEMEKMKSNDIEI